MFGVIRAAAAEPVEIDLEFRRSMHQITTEEEWERYIEWAERQGLDYEDPEIREFYELPDRLDELTRRAWEV